MNEIKMLFKILGAIIMEPLIREVLKFESPFAYSYFMKCSNTHKDYQASEVFVIAARRVFKSKVSINLATGPQSWVNYYNAENQRYK